MRHFKLVIMTKPAPGREREYNDWYQNVHLDQVVAIKGIKSAQRFRFDQSLMPGAEALPYLAIYDIETDDVDGIIKQFNERSQDGRIVISEALSLEGATAAMYEELGPVVRARER